MREADEREPGGAASWPDPGLGELFLGFFGAGMMGFGGVLPSRSDPSRKAKRLQAGLTPVTVGLVTAGAALIAASTTHGWGTGAITAATAAVVLGTRIHPLVPLAAGALLGALGAI